MLAVIDVTGNLALYDAQGKNPKRVTTDAAAARKLYQWPTWSTDGRLAFFGASAEPKDPYSLRAFLISNPAASTVIQTLYTSAADVFTYPYWSTGDCAPGCRDLALLYTPGDGSPLTVRMLRDDNGTFTDRVIGKDAPFYYSFSPDGSQMIWFRSGDQLDIYDVAADKTSALSDTPGTFNSPMWSPVSPTEILLATQGTIAATSDLVIADGAARRVILTGQDAPIAFAWSPDAKYIASVAGFAQVVISDAVTGKEVSRSSQSNIVAHFWSPTSDKIAYIVVNRDTPAPQARLISNGKTPVEQATGGLTAFVMDVQTGNSQPLATFNPSRDYVYLLNFADQFARSHSLWSPDGRWFTVAEQDENKPPAVYIVDTNQTAAPQKVADGSIGIWSWK